jgi:hypothetical protein
MLIKVDPIIKYEPRDASEILPLLILRWLVVYNSYFCNETTIDLRRCVPSRRCILMTVKISFL